MNKHPRRDLREMTQVDLGESVMMSEMREAREAR